MLTLTGGGAQQAAAASGNSRAAIATGAEVSVIASIAPPKLPAGSTNEPLVVIGANFEPGMLVELCPGVTVTYPDPAANQTPTKFTINVSVDEKAATTDRYVTLVNPDCDMARSDVKFHVDPVVHAATGAAPCATTEPYGSHPGLASSARAGHSSAKGKEGTLTLSMTVQKDAEFRFFCGRS